MKKLMIAAAAAAMIGGAYADLEAQAYDFTATLKTTNCREAKVTKALEAYFAADRDGNFPSAVPFLKGEVYEKGDRIGLRKQASRKIVGIIWGCDCPTIALPAWRVFGQPQFRTIGGYIFWDQAADDYFRIRTTYFGWTVLNRIDAMTKCEGAFQLLAARQGATLALFGAGFGSVKDTGCASYVSTISGNCAGFRQPNDADISSCKLCAQADDCTVAPICDWCFVDLGAFRPFRTIAYGTWKIKYNSSVTKRLHRFGYLTRSYTFKNAGNAAAVLDFLEDAIDNGRLDASNLMDYDLDVMDEDYASELCDYDDDKKQSRCEEAVEEATVHYTTTLMIGDAMTEAYNAVTDANEKKALRALLASEFEPVDESFEYLDIIEDFNGSDIPDDFS